MLKIKIIILPVFCALAFFALAGQAEAATRVISPSGNGSTCSSSSPCSWTTAYSASGSGDVIQMRGNAGSYTSNYVIGKAITVQAYPGETPIIDGQDVRPGPWEAIIRVTASNATVDGLDVRNAGPYSNQKPDGNGNGIIVFGNITNVTIKNNIVHHTGDGGIWFQDGVTNSLAENNTVYETCIDRTDYGYEWWGAAMVVRSSSGITFRGNTLRKNGGEGINLIQGAENCILEKNIISDTARPGIFFSSSRNSIARYNVVYCTMDSRYFDYSGNSCGPGIALAGEYEAYGSPTYNSGHHVYGNMVTGGVSGLAIAMSFYPNTEPINNYIYNNTFVEANSTDGNHSLFIMETGSNNYIRNNIFFQTTGTIASTSGGSGIFGSNLWSKAPPSNARASTDPRYSTYSTLNIADYFQKITGWTSLSTASVNDFVLRSTAQYAIDDGTNLGIPYNSDYYGNLQSGTWDIGALVYGGTTGAVCGNSIVESGEQCDLGTAGNGICPKICSVSCTTNSCGSTPGNIAPQATVTASTQNTTDSQTANKAIDGVRDGYPGDYTKEWATTGEGKDAYIQLDWSSPKTINKIILYDRPNTDDQITGGTLTFSDGSTASVPSLNNDGSATTINFSNKNITWVKLTVNSTSATSFNIGLAEFEVFEVSSGGDTQAPNAPGGLSVR